MEVTGLARMERAFYKLLWVALTLVVISVVFRNASQVSGVLVQLRLGVLPWPAASLSMVLLTGQTLMAIAALYWIPRIVRQLVPEVLER